MKYRITLSQTVTETAVVTIEADDEELAEQTALNLASGVIDPTSPEEEVVWTFTEIEQDAEVIHSEEWPPVNERDPEIELIGGEPRPGSNVVDLIAALKATDGTADA